MKIIKVGARQIFNSNGFATVECQLKMSDGTIICASVPSGTSKGTHEAVELKSENILQSVGQAVMHVQEYIAPLLIDQIPDVLQLDSKLLHLDATPNKSMLGANAILAASIATARAQAHSNNISLYQLLAALCDRDVFTIPRPQFNMFSGGLHAPGSVIIQEFMIMPTNQDSFRAVLEDAMCIFHVIAQILKKKNLPRCIGPEGAFVVHASAKQLLDILVQALDVAPSRIPFCIGLDVAASSFYDRTKQKYAFDDEWISSQELIDRYKDLVCDYPIVYIEDGMAEDDWHGSKALTEQLGSEIQIVGDDLFATNIYRFGQGAANAIANGIIIKPNQIGTVTEALQVLLAAQNHNYTTIVSHRSAETEDTFIADLAVGTGADQIKAGGCCRSERVAKYNQLLRIEDELGINF